MIVHSIQINFYYFIIKLNFFLVITKSLRPNAHIESSIHVTFKTFSNSGYLFSSLNKHAYMLGFWRGSDFTFDSDLL